MSAVLTIGRCILCDAQCAVADLPGNSRRARAEIDPDADYRVVLCEPCGRTADARARAAGPFEDPGRPNRYPWQGSTPCHCGHLGRGEHADRLDAPSSTDHCLSCSSCEEFNPKPAAAGETSS